MNNMAHCFENIVEEIKWTNFINDGGCFTKPEFVGQGCTYSVGSDCYGYYVAEIKYTGKKTIYGLVGADSRFERSWADGSMNCRMPVNHTPTKWVVQSGFWKNRQTGEKTTPKFYFCDSNGHKFNGQKCTYNWNGAHSYQDPSF